MAKGDALPDSGSGEPTVRDELALGDTEHSADGAGGQDDVSGDDATVEAPIGPLTGQDLEDEDGGRTAGMALGPTLVLERPLGKGGMGSVWVARHLKLDTEVAVKFIADRLVDKSDTAAKRFEREARLAAKMKSPHAVKVFDHGTTEEGVPYIVMELLHGESLAERLDKGPLSPAEASRVVLQVAEVLREAHGVGVVHRDIKPQNIFLSTTSYDVFTKVLDFGVARHVKVDEASVVTETGALVGTPYYMSPEQLLHAREPGEASDLWALAVVSYQALTGTLPFRGDTVAALGAALSSGEFEAPTSLRSSLPPELDDWFARALAGDLEDRFADVMAMADSFAAACGAPRQSVSSVDRDTLLSENAPRSSSKAVAVATFDGSSSSVGRARRGPNKALIGLALAAVAVLALAFGVGLSEPKPTSPSAASGAPTSEASGASPVEADEQASAEPTAEPSVEATTEPSTTATAEPSGQPKAKPPRSKTPKAPPPKGPAPPPVGKADGDVGGPATAKPAWCNDPKMAFERDADGYTVLKKACR